NLHFSPPDDRSTRYDRHNFAFPSQRLLAVLDVRSSTPARAKRRAPRPDGPLTHFTAPRGEKCRLMGTAGKISPREAGHSLSPAAGDDFGRLRTYVLHGLTDNGKAERVTQTELHEWTYPHTCNSFSQQSQVFTP
ncbi:MAG: hypothetical protein OXB98_21615, partial [Bryobacterales bacterium]|nr:hypothetical protein [Bryobacterales bacterium]